MVNLNVEMQKERNRRKKEQEKKRKKLQEKLREEMKLKVKKIMDEFKKSTGGKKVQKLRRHLSRRSQRGMN
jgi:hypothetical protein|tara:strand:- start:160 stop:372 length:213 start_codon:yes stop_codon:yes gene_type:complete